ncbi:histamine N-methyltransferase-like [Anneissia japonica]|uniref:histamine N-methyltransferase-like n=1 Tax=Anneissia japonica TaxID=1529436 RepID=UPI0014258F7E|nr:histamine N-methyltransferase-like [Anneissia japonica]
MDSTLSTERYAASFLEFRRMSDQSERMKYWLKHKLEAFMENDKLTSVDECRILGVGSGVGAIDCFILENIRRKHDNIFVRVLEPNVVEMEHFKNHVRSNKLYDMVKFDWRLQDALKYLKNPPDKLFHIIHLFHVLYYFDESEIDDVIQRCYNQLENGGHLLIIQGSSSNTALCIRKAFCNELNLKGKLNSIPGEDLLYKINALGYAYDSNDIRASLDVSICLDLNSETGSLLWDFITSVQKFLESSPKILVCKMTETLKAMGFMYDGRTFIHVDSLGISIQKSLSS